MAQESKKVSRRKAIKLITATVGAASLANLPNKWVKPVLKAGVLPAHAQTSPTATATPTNTSTPTNTPTNTPTSTPTNTPTATPGPNAIASCTGEVNDLGNASIFFWNTTATLNLAVAGISVLLTIIARDGSGNTIAGPQEYGPELTDTNGTATFIDTSIGGVDFQQLFDAVLTYSSAGLTPCSVTVQIPLLNN
jgi:hypothetical protein